MLVDSDVLIWYMRGHERAKALIENLGPFAISAVTYMELIQGMRSRFELNALRRFLAIQNVSLLHLAAPISEKAAFFMEEFSLGHGLRMADALVAATSSVHGLILVTANMKHYRFIKDIQLKAFRP